MINRGRERAVASGAGAASHIDVLRDHLTGPADERRGGILIKLLPSGFWGTITPGVKLSGPGIASVVGAARVLPFERSWALVIWKTFMWAQSSPVRRMLRPVRPEARPFTKGLDHLPTGRCSIFGLVAMGGS